VTKVRRTLEDLSSEGNVVETVIRQGVEEGLRRGVLSLREVVESPILRKMAPLARKVASGRVRP